MTTGPQERQVPRRPEFLEREVYQQRRLLDALRLLPVLGVIAFIFPALIQGGAASSTAGKLVYFFAAWAGLIALCAVLVRLRTRSRSDTRRNGR